MSSQILLYNGFGSGPFCVEALKSKIEQVIDDRCHKITTVASFKDCLTDPKSIKAVVIPGGNALSTCAEAINNSNVINFIKENHISYFGSCAGAILASRYLHMRDLDNNSLNIFRKNEYELCSLYPDDCVAPIYPLHKTITIDDFKITPIRYKNNNLKVAQILSPAFLNERSDCKTSIISTYVNETSLTILDKGVFDLSQQTETLLYNNGYKLLLTASHAEIDSKVVRTQLFKTTFSATLKEQAAFANELATDDLARDQMFTQNLQLLNIATKS
ncbi:hypothetical protein BN1013_00722 [Candidatus Rubidus massiliensis]|nr:MAG: hypothetical protein BGO10_09865 [Chlamydia sp. 32-24]CDZ80216.1 hypothetical protein BN1013_00722 [Candidatus Rubidus massiliensis]